MKILLNLILILLVGCTASTPLNKTKESSNSLMEYDIQDVLLKTRDEGTISAMAGKRREEKIKKPVLLQYTIYANQGLNYLYFSHSDKDS